MAFTLEQIVPWGRSLDEYVGMFALTAADLEKRILGCGDGPASFNAAMQRRGGRVVSVDPLYQFSAAQIRGRVDAACQTILAQLVAHQAAYVWTTIASPNDLARVRLAAAEAFLADYEAGKREGRYLPLELPSLPFENNAFDLALSSHLLFTYSDQLSTDFHCQSVMEMCRVAREVRVFPVLHHNGQTSPHLEPVCQCLDAARHHYAIEPVQYEFQRGADKMLRVWRDVA